MPFAPPAPSLPAIAAASARRRSSRGADSCRTVAPLVRRTVGRFVADRTLAEDLAQEALLRVHLCAAGFRGVPDGPAFARWCISLARNTAIDGIRRERRRRASTVDPDTLGDTRDPESLALATEREHLVSRSVREAIAELPPASRQVVTLHKIEGLTMEEIAARLGAHVGTVRVRAHRGYVALARRLARDQSSGVRMSVS